MCRIDSEVHNVTNVEINMANIKETVKGMKMSAHTEI